VIIFVVFGFYFLLVTIRLVVLYTAVRVLSLDTAIQVAAVVMVVMHLLCKAVGKDLALLLLINFLMLINEELV
jgi:hypothetical protein